MRLLAFMFLVTGPLSGSAQTPPIEIPPPTELIALLNFGDGYPLPSAFVASVNAGETTYAGDVFGATVARVMLAQNNEDYLFTLPVDHPTHVLTRYVVLEYASCQATERAHALIGNAIARGAGPFLHVQFNETLVLPTLPSIQLPCAAAQVPATGRVGAAALAALLLLTGLGLARRRAPRPG